MRVKVLERSEREVKMEVEGESHTFMAPLVTKLLEDERVDVATYEISHPILSNPVLFVRLRSDVDDKDVEENVENADVIDVLKSAVSSLKEDFEEFERKYRAAMV